MCFGLFHRLLSPRSVQNKNTGQIRRILRVRSLSTTHKTNTQHNRKNQKKIRRHWEKISFFRFPRSVPRFGGDSGRRRRPAESKLTRNYIPARRRIHRFPEIRSRHGTRLLADIFLRFPYTKNNFLEFFFLSFVSYSEGFDFTWRGRSGPNDRTFHALFHYTHGPSPSRLSRFFASFRLLKLNFCDILSEISTHRELHSTRAARNTETRNFSDFFWFFVLKSRWILVSHLRASHSLRNWIFFLFFCCRTGASVYDRKITKKQQKRKFFRSPTLWNVRRLLCESRRGVHPGRRPGGDCNRKFFVFCSDLWIFKFGFCIDLHFFESHLMRAVN